MEKNWFRLDNAALIFPPVSGVKSPNTFCICATFDEKIDKDLLTLSLNQVLESEDSFKVRMKKGLFWYYFEKNDKQPIILDDRQNFLEYIDYRYGDNYLFKVFVGEQTIRIVYFHALTDGTGGLYFFKQVLYRYFQNRGDNLDTEGLVKTIEFPTINEEVEDKFLNIKTKDKEKKIPEQKAFKLSGRQFKSYGTGIITAISDMQQIKDLAKSYNTTITAFLCAVYLQSIYESYIENKNTTNKNVCISIPVNIRKRHPSVTKRNFSLVIRVSCDFSTEIEFSDLVALCDKQLKEKITVKQLDAQIKFNTNAQKNIFMRIVPLFIKNFILKIAYKVRGTRQETTNLSNLGNVEFPKEIEKHVLDFNFILQASNTTQKNFSVVGFNNKLYYAFSRRHIENKTEKIFFEKLTKLGVDFVVSSNYQEAL